MRVPGDELIRPHIAAESCPSSGSTGVWELPAQNVVSSALLSQPPTDYATPTMAQHPIHLSWRGITPQHLILYHDQVWAEFVDSVNNAHDDEDADVDPSDPAAATSEPLATVLAVLTADNLTEYLTAQVEAEARSYSAKGLKVPLKVFDILAYTVEIVTGIVFENGEARAQSEAAVFAVSHRFRKVP